MKRVTSFFIKSLIGGLVVVLPVYLAILLLGKAISTALGIVRPITALIPDWLPGEQVLALLLVLLVCFLVGAAVKTRQGQAAREKLEQSLFERIPGYALFRSLTQQITGRDKDSAWKSALAEIEDALVPAFIIEEIDSTRCTVLVHSIPTPMAGTVYVLPKERVHPLDVKFTQAVSSISRWGSGVKELVQAMEAKRAQPAG
jgi:uncharacterized membrane protein